MLPERAEVFRTQRIPTAREAHEARVEGVNLRLLDDFVLTAAVKRADQRDGMGDFQRTQVALQLLRRKAMRFSALRY